MAQGGLKVLSYAFKEMRSAELNNLFERFDVESPDFRKELETDMVYLCTFGMLDELREDIEDSVKQLKFGCEENACDG
jgi:magnesium-transporting ATPase (P-type)